MSHVLKPRKINGVVPPPQAIAVRNDGYARGFEPETIDALLAKARETDKGIAEYCRDVLVEHAER